MLIYWLLFVGAALMALAYPANAQRGTTSAAHQIGFAVLLIGYVVIGGLRDEIGGDWGNYVDIYDNVASGSLAEAVFAPDGLYAALNWVSDRLGGGIYLVNGLCCLLLVSGVIAVARTLEEPWMAIVIAVPYLLIVVGMGYVRQGAAIGLLLLAISAMDRSRPGIAALLLVVATGFHSTAVVNFPLFGLAFARRSKVLAVLALGIAAAVFLIVLAPRLNAFEANYIDAGYDSGGALVRVLMGLAPALVVLARWKHFGVSHRSRSVWLMVALANVLAAVMLVLSPSSTAVDRLALFVSIIQLAMFGEFRGLLMARGRQVLFLRLLLIGVAAGVQAVWLVYSPYAIYWVPYQWLFDTPY